ncbi:MAG TPA: AAA family ATPase [Gaiellaceae bacterium]
MAVDVVGRDEELAQVRAFLGRAGTGGAALELYGAAGIGKSTIWLAGVEAARSQAVRTLITQPSEAERSLAFAGLGDLLDGLLDEVLPSATPPQRRALEVALLLRDAQGEAVDPRALGLGVRGALDVLAGDAALVVAVDDVQWLDASSAAALVFALRRLPDVDVRLLLARRSGEASEASSPWGAIDPGRVERLRVGPLRLGAVHRLLQARLGRTFPRPTLLRVHEAAGGNPFYALELARALETTVSPDPTEPLPVPETLDDLVGARLGALPGATRNALVLAATLERPSPKQLRAAGVSARVLEPAEAADVIEVSHDAIRFTHPLLASVLYQRASGDERRHAHAAAAGVVDDDTARARHLALASDSPDTALAATLDRAAETARTRGAAATAAELGELAARSTLPENQDDLRRRLLRASRDHLAAGARPRAEKLAERILDRAGPGGPRAEALTLLGEIEVTVGSPFAAIQHLKAALDERPYAPKLECVAHDLLAWSLRATQGVRAAEPHARAASELARSTGEPALTARALAVLAGINFTLGRTDAFEVAERALSLALSADDPTALVYSREALGHCLFFRGRLDEARDVILESCQWGEKHDEPALESALWYLGLIEYRAGRWDLARQHAERQRALWAPSSNESSATEAPPLPLLLVTAASGDGSKLPPAEEAGDTLRSFGRRAHTCVVATAALWSGDPLRAADGFATYEAEQEAAGSPSVLRWLFRAEEVEALLALGRTDDALAVLEPWEDEARRLGLAWPLAEATRCRGFLASARGEVEEATTLFSRAVDEHEAVGDPFGRARARLALGTVHRRARRKRAAREAIEAAISGFDGLGAAVWAERARAELGRIGGRTRTEGLTPAESRVAKLVAEGRTNREVAAALFLGERTVESHLSHVYAKLGVRSRTELARALSPARQS